MKSDVDESPTSTNTRPNPTKRESSTITPSIHGMIQFKTDDTDEWLEGEIVKAGDLKEEDKLLCDIRLDNDEILSLDFGKNIEWNYKNLKCTLCKKEFTNKRGRNQHAKVSHKSEPSTSIKSTSISEAKETLHDTVSKDIDAIATTEDKSTQEEAALVVHDVDEENHERQIAKENEMKNFEEYDAYEEVEFTGQKVLGSRYVFTRKEDGSLKARFVIKGFQENLTEPSDSPTASRETLKIFLSIVANEKWLLKAYDVKSAFLQAENIKRNIFVEPRPEKKGKGLSGNYENPSMD